MQESKIKLRIYRSDDCTYTLKLFYDTVHSVNSADYTIFQLAAWAPKETDPLAWDKRLSESYTVVAEKDRTIVGFGSASDMGYFDLLYVHKECQRMGIATLIADDIERYFTENGIRIFTAEASVTARPFFEKRGFVVQAKQRVERGGQYLTNYKMQKEGRLACIYP